MTPSEPIASERTPGERPAGRRRVAVRALVHALVRAWASLLVLAVGPSSAVAQGCLPANDLAVVEEARARIDRYGALVWPGWREAPPMLLRGDGEDCLIGHPEPSDGFVESEDGVHRRPGHLVPVPAATAWPVGDRWSVAVPLRSELQALVDEHVGPGAIELDDEAYLRTLVHEAFHAFQMTVLGGPDAVPTMGAVRPGDTLASLQGDAEADAAHEAVGAALSAALDAATSTEALAALRTFVERRDAWWAEAPTDVPGLERHLEWLEGTARYADVLVAMGVGGRGGDVSASVWLDLRDQIAHPTGIRSGLRDRYAAFGAAQAFLLDRWSPGWKSGALPGGDSLDTLIRSLLTDLGTTEPPVPDAP